MSEVVGIDEVLERPSQLLVIGEASRITGLIDLGDGVDTFHGEDGAIGIYTFFNSLPEVLTHENGAATSNPATRQVAFVDDDAFASSHSLAVDIAGGVSSAIAGRVARGFAAAGGGAAIFASVDPGVRVATSNSGVESTGAPNMVFAEGFGGLTDLKRGPNYDSTFAGGLFGYGRSFGAFSAGLYVGYASGEADSRGQTWTADYYLGGVFANGTVGRVSASFNTSIGFGETDASRVIQNNVSPTGVSTLTGSYDSFFVSPEMKLGYAVIETESYRLSGVAHGRVTAVYNDNDTLTGAGLALRINGDWTAEWEARVGPEAVWSPAGTGGEIRAVVGGVARATTGSDLDGVVIGNRFSLSGDADEEVGGFAGLTLGYERDHVAIFVGGEGELTTQGHRLLGKAGLSYRF